ncbi:MAG TPA: TIGR03862 family flavoprotein [Gammaproteobacteria bacterium]|nr:TIGR03862 family flavoprotein [Gammaproteobacteria bacterium]
MHTAVVVGGGPAGLMAAEVLAQSGVQVDVYDAMPSVGRKFLRAGVGGLNLTHAEDPAAFVSRYGAGRVEVGRWLADFGPEALRAWALDLGVKTFTGTSGRVFPKEMKAAPLLRAWLRRLRQTGVRFHLRHRWCGWDENGSLRFDTTGAPTAVRSDATVLALGGGSWSKLGSDATWVPWLQAKDVTVAPLKPANCGFDTVWSEHFRDRFAGQPVKPVTAWLEDGNPRQGEFIVTAQGVEGGLIYTLSALMRDAIEKKGSVTLHLDLAPNRDTPRLAQDLAKPRGTQSQANHLRKQAGIDGVKAGLLREVLGKQLPGPAELAAAIKDLPLQLRSARPLDEAISSAGGVAFTALDERLMLHKLPGVFCAGEMLDWEAPTGGYLLTACFASGRVAGTGASRWLRSGGSA